MHRLTTVARSRDPVRRDRGAETMKVGDLLTVREAAAMAKCSPKRLRNLMSNGTLVEGVHYVRPRGRNPLFKHDGLDAWLAGADDRLLEKGA